MSDKPKVKPKPTPEQLEKALSDIAAFPKAVAVFYDAQHNGMCSTLDELLVFLVNNAAILFRVRNDKEHLRIVNSVKVISSLDEKGE